MLLFHFCFFMAGSRGIIVVIVSIVSILQMHVLFYCGDVILYVYV
jgi:hypothetical protein